MHLDDDAEAYALGLLDASERERVEAHITTCEPCLRRVGEAERTVMALVDATAPALARPRAWVPAALAGLGLALAAAIVTALGLQNALTSDGELIALMSTSHFAHVQFHTPAGAPVDVKVVYERHGGWYSVIARGAPNVRVTLIEPDGTHLKLDQRFVHRGGASYLTIDHPPAIAQLELDDPSGGVVATAEPLVTR
jgi:anti-sigma factor RsiW